MNVRGRSRYLMDNHHWRVQGATDFSRFFPALGRLTPPASLLALADGAWPSEVQAVLSKSAAEVSALVRPSLAREFDRAFILPITESQMAELAALADRHAEPEIAIHLAAFTADGPWLEWFDAPGDPIAVSRQIPRDAIARFADEVGGACDEVNTGV